MRWLSTTDGDLDQAKLKTVAIVFLGVAGGLAIIVGTLYQTLRDGTAVTQGLYWIAGICVAPLTGGAVGLGIGSAQVASQARAARLSQSVRKVEDVTEPKI